MASSERHNPAFLYGAHVHLMRGRGWVKSLSDEEREVTSGSTESRIHRGGWPRCRPWVQCAGSQLFIAAHYYRHCQPDVSGAGGKL